MKLTIRKQIGKTAYPFTFEGDNLHEVVMESKKLSFYDIYKCGICESDSLFLSAHVAQGKFKYTEIRCGKCKASLTFGQKQDDSDVFYLRRNDDKSYAWKKPQNQGVTNSTEDAEVTGNNDKNNDDLPF